MGELNRIYHSEELFPFFQNRLVNKSRPEYSSYLRWLGLDELDADPLTVLAVTGGVRATDSFELIPAPKSKDGNLVLDFFPRGLRYTPQFALSELEKLQLGDKLYIAKDIQNVKDSHALLLRTGSPSVFVGYIAKYYSRSLCKLLDIDPSSISVFVKKINLDAPLDMRLLCTITTPIKSSSNFLESDSDFLPWTGADTVRSGAFLDTGIQLDIDKLII